MKNLIIVIALLCIASASQSQNASISGSIYSAENNAVLPYAQIVIEELNRGTVADKNGNFVLDDIPQGTFEIKASFLGFKAKKQTVSLDKEAIHLDFVLHELLIMDEVVITGTKTFKRQTNSPVIVNVINDKQLEDLQTCTLSEGLNFQPGLRVETDCQTCNYTQLRMNGLGGGYSQILINGRPIFSPLTGLYGLEQIPTNMIDKIEVVRGGGSSLYGSSAIGGTVNVLTKIPDRNEYEAGWTYQNINGGADDQIFQGNASVVSPSKKVGATLFLNHRNRDYYDHNGDNFSELPELTNTSIGINTFLLPTENQKIELSFSNLKEYRYGGEMVDKPAHLALQSEERDHDVYMGTIDYQINFNEEKTSLITYAALQKTIRDHYTGIFPDDEEAIQEHISNPPYGDSEVSTLNLGIQLNHKLSNFPLGDNVFTLGVEHIYDDVRDEIPAYQYLIDQTTRNTGVFVQSDWELFESLNLLSGVRMDHHNLMDQVIFNPRLSLLYKLKEYTQFRINYGTGFRAPQAFDTDLHIAFAGGGISRVILSDELAAETSKSISTSINFDYPTETYVAGFTLEGFYNRLNNAFILQPIGEDAFGEVFEKQNAQNADVLGMTFELRANYNRKYEFQTGITIQNSNYDQPVQYIDGVVGQNDFIRTPNYYGFAMFTAEPTSNLLFNLNYTYTGSMTLPHFAGAINHTTDEIIETEDFHNISLKAEYDLRVYGERFGLSIFSGVKNIFNAYQNDFDLGKNRDSNYIYGPNMPRTIFFGIKLHY